MEARRVLRPGGLLNVMTWLGREPVFDPDEVFWDALDDLDLDVPDEDEEPRSGNFGSVPGAVAQVRRAGFRDVRATEAMLVHAYDPETYLEFLEAYAERGTFEDLDEADRDRLRALAGRRLAELPVDAFVWRMSVVTVLGRKPPAR